jgi:hypothetical protein
MVWSASVAEVVSRVTIGLGVMMALTGVTRGSIPSPTTCVHIVSMCGCHKSTNGETAYPEREILGGKDAAQVFVLVDDQDAVSPLRRAKLTHVRDAHAMWDGQGGEGPEGRDGALLGSRDALAAGGSTRGGAGALRARSLAREFSFDLLADGLRIQWAGAGCVSVQRLGKRRTLMPFSERLQLPETLDAYATPMQTVASLCLGRPLSHCPCTACRDCAPGALIQPSNGRVSCATHLVALGLALAGLCEPLRASWRGARYGARGREVARARLRVSAPG